MRFKNPQQPVRAARPRHASSPTSSCQIRVNGDLALFQALEPAAARRRGPRRPATVLDHAFIAEHTDGFDEYAARPADARPGTIVRAATGLPRERDRAAGRARSAAPQRIIVCWAMGLTQHQNSVATIREIVNLLLLRGNIGRPGAGVCPVRGHSNVQGDRTMGICEKPPAAFLDALRDEFGFEPPREHGYDVVDAIRAMRDGRVKVFIALGGNFVAATPGHRGHHEALRELRADRAGLDQAQPLARGHRRDRADPADPRPHRARRAARRASSSSPSRTR